MTARRLILLGAVSLLCAIVLPWLILRSSSRSRLARPAASTRAEAAEGLKARSHVSGRTTENNQANNVQLQGLEQRLRLLEGRLAIDDAQGGRRRAAAAYEGEQGSGSGNSEDGAELAAANVDPAALRHAQIKRLDGILNDESYDAGWSSKTEEMIASAFEQRGLEGSSLRGTKCGATFCRAIVRHRDLGSQSAFEALSPGTGRMGGIMLLTASAEGEPETTMYLVRKEFDSPEHPVRRTRN